MFNRLSFGCLTDTNRKIFNISEITIQEIQSSIPEKLSSFNPIRRLNGLTIQRKLLLHRDLLLRLVDRNEIRNRIIESDAKIAIISAVESRNV